MNDKPQTLEHDVDLQDLDTVKFNDLQNQAAALQGAHSEERDLVNQLLGQVQMASSFARFADVVSLTKLKHIKESKMYRALAGKKGFNPDGQEIADIGTFDGFCQALGLSRSKVDEDLTNLNAFGEQALQQLSALGVGYREMRQFRKLPEDQKTALLEVAKTGDKDSFLDLAEEIINRHSKEKEELTRERDEAKADYEAQSELLGKKTAALDSAVMELEKTRKRIQTLPAEEAMSELRREVASVAFECEATLMGRLRNAFDTLVIEGRQNESDERLYMAGLLRQVEVQIATIREDYDLPESFGTDSAPDWMNPEKAAQVEADIARVRAEKGL